MRRTILRLLSSFRSSRAERNLAREIRSHLQLLEDQYIATGIDAEEASYAALRAFGSVEQVKEHQREPASEPCTPLTSSAHTPWP